LAGPLGVQGLGRFFLDKVVDLLIEPDVVGMHGVEVELGPVDPLVGRRILGLGQGVDRGVLHVGHAAHADGVQPAPQGDQVCPPGTQFEEHLDAPHEVVCPVAIARPPPPRLGTQARSGAGDGNRTRVTSLEGASGPVVRA
jgi:hypothetical protein